MTRSPFRTRVLRVLAVMTLTVVVTCTEEHSPVAPLSVPRFAAAPFSGPAVLVGAGDIATCVNNNDELSAELLDGISGTVFTAGDNAYPNGRAVDYQNCYDPTWGRHKARTWATLGNHEYDSSATADATWDYFGDRAGPRGLGYYSYDLGAWHIVVLNDNGQFVPFTANSAQDQWFQADLAAHPNLCTLVMWHQPYTFSNKNAAGATTSPARKIFWDRAYAAGVDVVVNGHQHQYERFLPQTPDLVVDNDRGIREFIIGTGGESTAQPVQIAPNSVVQAGTFGVMKFTLKDGGYDWQFFPITGQTFTDAGSGSCHDAAGGASGALSTIVASPTTIMKGGPTATITVTAKDANGNPISGAFVSLAATGTGNTLTQPATYTDASGIATGTLSSTVTETKTITATVNGITLAQTAAVVVTAPASATKSKVTAVQPYVAVATGTATISVTVLDGSSRPVSGATVTLQATGSGNTLVQPVALTDANGVTTGTLSSTVVETKTVSAVANGTLIRQTASIVVTTPSAGKSTMAASPTSFIAGVGSSTITVTVRDAGNHQLAGAAVVLSATGTGNTLTQPIALTDARGVATGALSSADAGSKVVSAAANGTAITKTATVTVNANTVSASLSTVAASPTSVPTGATSTITVTVKNGSGQPVSGATVVLAATGSGNALTQPAGVTDASGVATGALSSTVAEAKTVSATANGIALTQTAVATVTSGGVSASQSTLGAAPGSIVAGSGLSTITVTAKDAGGNAISGATVVLAATGSGNTLVQPAATTDANGVASGTLSSTVAESKTVSATVNGVSLTQTATVSVTPGSVAADRSTVGAAPTTIEAGNGTSSITVTAKDANGNPISGATVVLAATGAGNTLVQPAGVTNASGVATGSLSSTVAESKTVSATINGTAITQTAGITVTAATISASLSTVGAAPPSIVAGSGSTTITVTVLDGTGQPVSGANVVLASTGTQNTLVQPVGPTDANGVATGTLSSNKAELKTISATAAGVAITQTAAVTVTAGSVSGATSTVSAAPTSIAPGSETSTIRVTAKDAFGNPVSGVTVVLSASGSGNTLTQPSGTTNSIGVASGTLSSTVAETKTVSATANGVAIQQTATVTVTNPTQGAITHTLLTSGNDVNNVKIFTTASIAPAPNTLVTVAVTTHNSTAAAPSPTLTGGGMASWEVVATITYDVVGTPKKRITIYRAMSSTPGSGPITITSSATLSNCQWIVSQWSGVETGGTNGSGAIVQTGSNAADAVTTLSTPLAAFANSADVAYGVFGVNSNVVAITPA
ncbi:MAG TPA: invasin domain 3-containing protein, partial [Gemmatimonadales bacterium]